MERNEKAIELEGLLNCVWANAKRGLESANCREYLKMIKTDSEQGLALLKPPAAEPEVGKFVKTAREVFIEAFNGEAIPADIYTQGLELCSLLEAAQKRIAELEAEKKKLRDLLRSVSGWMSMASLEEGTPIEDLQKRLSKLADKIDQALKEPKDGKV